MLPFLRKRLYSLRVDFKQLSKIATEVVLPSFSNPYYMLLSKTLFFVLCFCLWFSLAYFFQYFKDPPHTLIFYIYKVCLCAVNIRIYFLWCIKNAFFFNSIFSAYTKPPLFPFPPFLQDKNKPSFFISTFLRNAGCGTPESNFCLLLACQLFRFLK